MSSGLAEMDIAQLVIDFNFEDDEEANYRQTAKPSHCISQTPFRQAIGTPASTMFSFMTAGSDDLAISARSTGGEFRFLSATATVTFDEPPPPPDVKSPSLLRHSSSERVWRGLA